MSNVDPELVKQIQIMRKLAGTTVIADHIWEEDLSDEQVYEKERSKDWDGDTTYGGSASVLDYNLDLDLDESAHVDDRGSGEEESMILLAPRSIVAVGRIPVTQIQIMPVAENGQNLYRTSPLGTVL
ncbi:hypothetical protein SARC_07429 [Sphaeroforma arctica JP610]|uniref:Uncharacterized protein n=1 Tax=Sphaeroforma arctica JP610 TaxID=667725 RepID=A0A0L0FW78_9EUKA|nr:hypothetical protein SARC_07429 [Sphaeroforma arctica JP610]KNC80203.1 hypothetical protein SARC_07429 [Sphaeroforma arctica JP610]|eukprot:XP_014154105.1 hypothetical protein SARC_07429 [Sphaeroforma arctica JP610]